VVTDLLTGLRKRGLDATRAIFVGIDGDQALRAAVLRVFEHPVIARCQLHKIRNVADKLPDQLAATITKRCCRPITPSPHCSPRRSSRRWPRSWSAHPPRRGRQPA